jgi:hypothetical protein
VTHVAKKPKLQLAGKPRKRVKMTDVQATETRKPLAVVTNTHGLGPMLGKRIRKPAKKYGE